MSTPITYYKADGTAATDMSVTIYGAWKKTSLREVVSWQLVWNGNVTGTWTIEGTNVNFPEVTETQVDTYPSSAYSGTPSQPDGSAGSTTIAIAACNSWHRPKFVPSAGGTGVTPSGDFSRRDE